MKESILIGLKIIFLAFTFWIKKKNNYREQTKKLEEEFNDIKKIGDKKEKASRINALFNRVNRLHK